MKIIITPHDIIERALWDDYQYYILSRDKDVDIDKVVLENKEFEINEQDALVIGLLKCIETDNLIHRCNQFIEYLIQIRCNKQNDTFYLKKKILVDSLLKYDRKFPQSWKPRLQYIQALKDVKLYIDELLTKIEDLPIIEVTDKFGTHELIRTIHIRKILTQHN